MYYLLLSNGSKYLATRLRAVISVVYGYIRQIMLIIHESDDDDDEDDVLSNEEHGKEQ